MKGIWRGLVMVATALLLASGTTFAADSTWTNTSSSTFNDGNSWDNGEPGSADKATFDSGASYTVSFDATKSNTQAYVVLGGQNVTWDLNGNNYFLTGIAGWGLVATNTGDTGTFTIMDGTLRTVYAYGAGFNSGPGISVLVTNGGYVTGLTAPGGNTSINVGGTLTVAGSDATVYVFDQMDIAKLHVFGGSTNNFLRSGYIRNATIDDSKVAGWAALVGGYLQVGTINLTNGGVYTASVTPHGAGGIYAGQDDGYAWINIGGGSDMTRTSRLDGTYFYFNRAYNESGSGHLAIHSNGLLQITSAGHAIVDSSGPVSFGPTDLKIADYNAATLLGGQIQMTTNSYMTLVDFGSVATPGILRGWGSISNYNAGANFKILNDGWIRPGDTGTNWNHNVVGIGALHISGGDLFMTNPLSLKQSALYFDFSDTALDQIIISGGAATITGGSNVWSLASGAAPLGPYKYGLGTYDFIVASDLVWQPEYANLTNMLALAGLTQGLDYQFGIVDLGGGLQALRLEFVPEPSTVMLLLGGGCLLWRVRRRRR